jgi:acetyl esterase/lipase
MVLVRCLAALAVLVIVNSLSRAQGSESVEIRLWENGAPNGPTKPTDEPVLFLYRPTADAATQAAVIVCPGGGYGHLSMEREGSKIAEWLNSFGVTAFVLRYRHAGTGHQHPVPMEDGQRAIRTVRTRAAEWNLDPNKLGVMGFSAGGHLASTLGTHYTDGDAVAKYKVERVSSRPDFLILCYPVITMTADYMHRGSRDNLLGKEPDELLTSSMSSEQQVTHRTPPTFLFHTDADTGVPPANSIAFYEALHRSGVPAELHIYQNGGHGVGLAADIPGTRDWPERCRAWLEARGLLAK